MALLRCDVMSVLRDAVTGDNCVTPTSMRLSTKDGPFLVSKRKGIPVTESVELSEQVILTDREGNEKAVRLFPQMTKSAIQRLLDSQEIQRGSIVSARYDWCDEH